MGSEMCIRDRLNCDLTVWGRSFMWHKNSKRPSTVPCGTPESTVVASEEVPSITTEFELLHRSNHSWLCTINKEVAHR